MPGKCSTGSRFSMVNKYLIKDVEHKNKEKKRRKKKKKKKEEEWPRAVSNKLLYA